MARKQSDPILTKIGRRIAAVLVTAVAVTTLVAAAVTAGAAGFGAAAIPLVVGVGVAGAAVAAAWMLVGRVWRGWLGAWISRLEGLAAGAAGQAPVPAAGPDPPGLAEAIGRVSEALRTWQTRLADKERELVQAQRSLEAAVGGMPANVGVSRSVFQDPLDETHEMLNRLSPDLRWLRSSPLEAAMLGYEPAELVGRRYLDIVVPEDRPLVERAFAHCQASGESHDHVYRVLTRQQEVRHVRMDASARYDGTGQCIAIRCHTRDITDQLRAEAELRTRTEALVKANAQLRRMNAELERLKNRYSDLYHHSPVMYYSLDAEGVIVGCNETMVRRLGYRRKQLVGQPYTVLLTDEMRRIFPTTFAEFKRIGELELETQWRKPNGEVIDVLVRSSALYDENRQFIRSRSVAEDITERKRLAEQVRQEAIKLAEANRRLEAVNKELDDFTYVVSHDLKEPLRTIEAFSRFLVRDYNDRLDDNGREFLGYLSQASVRMKRMIGDVLELSRIGRVTSPPVPVDLGAVMQQVRQDVRALVEDRRAELLCREPLPWIFGDRLRIGQLMQNLVSNGLKYNQSPTPRVEVGCLPAGQIALEPDPPPEAAHEAARNGLVVCYVRDNGIGIAPEYQERVFQLFQRLHRRDEYEGTGAGLAICRKIVEAHGGRLWLCSRPGEGSTFYVALPVASPGSMKEGTA